MSGIFWYFVVFCLCQNTKVRLSERKTKLYLSFSEREYLRICDAGVRLSERKTKLCLSFSEREYLRIRDAGVRLSERSTKKSSFLLIQEMK